MYLDRIAACDPITAPVYGAMPIRRAAADVLADADAADLRYRNGTRKSPIDGVPFSLKMSLMAAGVLTTNYDNSNLIWSPTVSSDIALALNAAGCVHQGMDNGPGNSPARTNTAAGGATKNPRNPLYAPGGSAGGSACSVAAGFTGFSIAIDTAGSIRIPCAYCGVNGFASTGGSVSNLRDVTTDMPSMPPVDMFDLNKYGPIARGLDDLALIYQIIAGPTALRPAIPRVFPSINPPLRKIRSITNLGIRTCDYQSQVNAVLAAQSCTIDTSMPTFASFDLTSLNNIYGGLANDAAALPLWFANNPSIGRTVNAYYAAQLPYTTTFSGKYFQARAHQIWLQAVASSLFNDVDRTPGDIDLLAMGTVCVAPPLMTGGDGPNSDYEANTALGNILGLPCLTVPIGFDPVKGTGIGLQLMGRWGHDLDVINFAKQMTLPGYVPVGF